MISRKIQLSLVATFALAVVGGGVYALAESGPTADTLAAPLVLAEGATAVANESRPAVEVWKSPTCGCCEGWVRYLEDNGFPVTTHDTEEVDAVKVKLGLTDPSLKSCHTATIDGYVVEGHVPVSDIEKLLAMRPDVIGISAPGMPMMSPGMASLEPKGYDVVSFDAAGNQAVFSSH